MQHIISQVLTLAIQALIASLVWRYYREKSFPKNLRYSTFGPRFWTGSVDSCVMWPLNFLVSILLVFGLPSSVGVTLIIIQNLAWLIYTVLLHAKYGQTLGKMVCKVRVVDFGTEGAISFGQACAREGIPIALSLGLVGYMIYGISTGTLSQAGLARGQLGHDRTFWILAMLPLLWFVAEAVTMLTNEKRRALHDFIAGTVVVRVNATE